MPAPKGHKPYNEKGEGGRPQKYTDEFIEKEADAFEEWMKKPDSYYFRKFAIDRGYSYNRIYEFAEVNERFSVVLSYAKQWQECKLAQGGMTNELNSGFTKFVMGNAHGWTDRTETKISGDSANPLAFILKEVDGTTKELADEQE